jgi:2,5-diamino-6-(ribosylamino)-4(3H)-pyrimidinone 5'-phosphate reductase
MISSLDGKVAASGKAGSLGSDVDRTVMRNLRACTDAVMIGAGTLRAEKLTLAIPENRARARESRGLRAQPLAVVATATGDVPLQEHLLGSRPENLLILASSQIPEEHLVTLSSHGSVETVAEEGSNLGRRLYVEEALKIMKQRYGVNVLLVEGGPAMNHSLVASGLADELFLTLAPALLGGDERHAGPTVLEGPPIEREKAKPRLISVHLADNELFLRYVLGLHSTAK